MLDPIPLFKREVFARLEDFSFELLTLSPERSEREWEYRWVKQEPIGALPLFQYLGSKEKGSLGPNSDTLTLTGAYYPHVSGRIDHLKILRDLAANGKPLRLVLADTELGQNLGLWIVRKIKETRTIFYADGIPRKIEFTLELEAYAQPRSQ